MAYRLVTLIFRRRRNARRRGTAHELLFARFSGRTIIVHSGLGIEWMKELLATGGGGRHLRFDIRQTQPRSPGPLERVVREQVLPLALPLPLVLKIGSKTILVRHLICNDAICHPAEIVWMLDEIGTRFHAALHFGTDGLRLERGLPPEENEINNPSGG
ncbi:MAG: hypothetical protein ACYDHM_04640 [Acidiferrobacterales bacterium]